VPDILWQTTWGSPLWESAFAADISASGRIAMAGPVDWPPVGGFVAIYEADGTQVYVDTIPESGAGLVWDSDASFVLVGEPPSGLQTLRHYDADGGELWTQADGTVAYSGALARTPSGQLIVGGGTETLGTIARFDQGGNPLGTFATPINLAITDLAVRGEGVVAIGVDINSVVWVGEYDAADTLLWSGSAPSTNALAVTIAADGTVFAAIRTPTGGSTLLRYAPDGVEQPQIQLPWAQSLVTDLLALDDGDVIVATGVMDTELDAHCTMSRINPAGTMTWGVSFAGMASYTSCTRILAGPDGTLVGTGDLRGPDGDADLWIVRVAT
jgi:hypothetical protein